MGRLVVMIGENRSLSDHCILTNGASMHVGSTSHILGARCQVR